MVAWWCSALAMAGPADVVLMGNSYTARNGLNERVRRDTSGAPGWAGSNVFTLARGGFTFSDHVGAIEEVGSPWADTFGTGTQWRYVVLQEQSQIPGFDPSDPPWKGSLAALSGLDGRVADAGAETVLLQTWGRRGGDAGNTSIYPDFATMQDRLTAGYAMYAESLSTVERSVWVAPAGEAFRWAHTEDPQLHRSLYEKDGSHPSPRGSDLVSAIVSATLTGRAPAPQAEWIARAVNATVLDDPFAMPRPFARNWPEGSLAVVLDADEHLRPSVVLRGAATPVSVRVGDARLFLLDEAELITTSLTVEGSVIFGDDATLSASDVSGSLWVNAGRFVGEAHIDGDLTVAEDAQLVLGPAEHVVATGVVVVDGVLRVEGRHGRGDQLLIEAAGVHLASWVAPSGRNVEVEGDQVWLRGSTCGCAPASGSLPLAAALLPLLLIRRERSSRRSVQ